MPKKKVKKNYLHSARSDCSRIMRLTRPLNWPDLGYQSGKYRMFSALDTRLLNADATIKMALLRH